MRTTAAEVKQIIITEMDDAAVEAYLGSANVQVTAVVGDKGLSDSLLKEIERWLTAHMIAATQERLAKKEGAGGAEIEYVGVFGQGLSSTPYGQMVLTLDTTGAFAALGLGLRSVRVTAIKS